MPWPRGRKAETRRRIVEAAAQSFRARGVAGAGVQDIMSRAELTHGGFYAHFGSKDELLGAAIRHACEQTQAALAGAALGRRPEQALRAVIDTYLSTEHARHPEQGCPVAALGPEVARLGGMARRDLARAIQGRFDSIAPLLGPRSRAAPDARDTAVGVVACMVGGLILARAAGGPESRSILDACKRFLRDSTERTG
jgi:TetR/AcrR family transcriptional repressor of nem operon